MKILNKALKFGTIKINVEHNDDLWVLQQIIDTGDRIKGSTQRKIKLESGSERTSAVIKKWVFLEIKVEKIDFEANALRISGPILDGPEDISRGSYHTISIEENSTIEITKEKWLDFQLKRLEDACSVKRNPIIICVFDREEAVFAKTTIDGYEVLSTIHGSVQKKDDRNIAGSSFFEDIIKTLKEYNERYNAQTFILASPAFWKDEIAKHLKEDSLKKKIVFATCSSASENAINEVLKRPEVQSALVQERAAKEINLVESVFKEISKDGKVTYGLIEIKKIDVGAISELLITDSLIKKSRENKTYDDIDRLLKNIDDSKGTIYIITSTHEGGKRLDGIGGIAALLRYKLQ